MGTHMQLLEAGNMLDTGSHIYLHIPHKENSTCRQVTRHLSLPGSVKLRMEVRRGAVLQLAWSRMGLPEQKGLDMVQVGKGFPNR